jgi:hypothetical protein
MPIRFTEFLKVLNGDAVDDQIIHELIVNKVLYFAGLYNKKLQDTEEWQERKRRFMLQRDAIKEFAEIAEKLSLRYLIVKTFKLFPYVPDDVDILVMDTNLMSGVINELKKRGYFIRKIGTPEVTIRKVANKTYVDLDIHHKMAAGNYIYYDAFTLWRNRRKITIDGYQIYVPSPQDECVITMAHAVLKEFEILLSDFLQNYLCIKQNYIEPNYLSLTGHIETYKLIQKKISLIVLDKIALPHWLQIWEVVNVYLHNLKHRMRRESYKPFLELVSSAGARGIKKVFALRI